MDTKEFRREFESRATPADDLIERLLTRLEQLEDRLRRVEAENERLKQRLRQYEPVTGQGETKEDSRNLNYSVNGEERRRRRKRRKKSPGRRRTAVKFGQATVFEDVRPEGVDPGLQRLVRKRAAWRLIHNKAVLVGYSIYGAPGVPEPRIPGLLPRGEYGLEIVVVLAFLVYIIRMSQAKACEVLRFFCELPINPSQADSLLRQLGKHWNVEFDALCDLLVRAAVVYMDETGWKVGQAGCSLWAFLGDAVRVFVFGCRKDAATLNAILPPDLFAGIGVSDDAAVYGRRFREAQKCWAHLLRKAIRLTLLYPGSQRYQRFLDELLSIFRDAKQAAADKRLSATGRDRRVSELEERLCTLCNRYDRDPGGDAPQHRREFCNLVWELQRLVVDEELFTFVRHPEVAPTNNGSERALRDPAQDRAAGRTSKTAAGAHRRSVIFSVLESLRAQLPCFTLQAVVAEAVSWAAAGIGRFRAQLSRLGEAMSSPGHFEPG